MPNRILALIVLGAVGLLGACGATRHSLGKPVEEIAVVKGSKEKFFQMLGVNSLIVIKTVDAQDLKQGMSGYPIEVEVSPGHHRLGIYYSFRIDGAIGPSGDATLEIDAEAGRTYQIRERFGSAGEVSFVLEEASAR